MREGVLPLNVFISVVYILVAGGVALLLKKSSRMRRGVVMGEDDEGWR